MTILKNTLKTITILEASAIEKGLKYLKMLKVIMFHLIGVLMFTYFNIIGFTVIFSPF